MAELPSFTHIQSAAERIRPHAHRTPLFTSTRVNRKAGCRVWFKCENFQRTGAFKFRGACNAVLSLSDGEAARGVATHSSGNHAQALSLAAAIRGIPAYIAIPENASPVKVAAVKGYGAAVTFCAPTQHARESTAARIVEETGAVLIHPFNHPDIIAGQGTAALELLQEKPDLDMILTPVGGGGLLSGTAITANGFDSRISVIGAEPEAADDACRSFKAKKLIKPESVGTVADGLRTSLGELTFSAICNHATDIVTVSEVSIIRDMRYIWERMKLTVEPSSAVPVSALFDKRIDCADKKVGVIISGGNVDLDRLPWQDE